MGRKRIFKLSPFQIILLGFAGVILAGTFILMLPISSNSKTCSPFINALFTSTSAVCVTGLIVYDTATHWSFFGQAVILTLIQIGGMGVVTLAILIARVTGKRIGIFGRSTMSEAISAGAIGGILKLTSFIVKGIFLIELVGALVMMPVFCIDYGYEGIWMAFFHSISAFCNAGFDIMGTKTGEFSSLTSYSSNPVINITIMSLIVVGGIGFLVWEDVVKFGIHIKKYRTQSKLVLIVTGLIILLPAIYFFFLELYKLPLGKRILASFFQSITPRTAGFNTIDQGNMSDVGIALTTILMMIGGSPGSTAGGMKTTTIAILVASMFSVFRKKDGTAVLGRRIDDSTMKIASAIFFMYTFILLFGGAAISIIEGVPYLTALFEVASAVATVGLTLGITPGLRIASKVILIFAMYFGRVGAMTLIFATFGATKKAPSSLPLDKISVG